MAADKDLQEVSREDAMARRKCGQIKRLDAFHMVFQAKPDGQRQAIKLRGTHATLRSTCQCQL
ncbi:hypothetical protein ABAC402_03240 [Asticcacaulis sp. AC402]|nr:hypothetical protein ABAC402_03240 [Asticcacaulis sp. AC402]